MGYATKSSAAQPVSSLFAAILFAGLLLASLMGAGAGRAWADTPHVTQHTKTEIVNYLANSGTSVGHQTTYAVQPELYNQMGELSDDTKQAALAMLNNIRYIAGLDPVTLNDRYGQLAQAAAFGDYSIGKLTHYPDVDGTKPDEMSDELWALCNSGTRSTNISRGYSSVVGAILNGWMYDGDMGNIDRIGHRRWCLNPEMGATGFGQASAFAAMYSFDASGSGSQTNVVWPAQLMPVEYFSAAYPWSISVGTQITDPSSVRVTVTKVGDEPTQWVFDELGTTTSSGTPSKYFNVNNDWYGQTGCIIFRPDNFTFAAGDVFHVQVSGVNGNTIEYDVEFMAGYPVESISLGEETQYVDSYYGTLYLNGAKTVQPDTASGYKIEWSSSDESVATVDSSGIVQKVAPGKTVVTATIPGRYTKSGNPVSASVDVIVPKLIYNDTSMSVDSASLEYTGETVAPKVTVTDNDTGAILVEGEDYSITTSNDAVEPNLGFFIYVNGLNYYSGTMRRYVYVTQRTVTEDMVSLVSDTLVYNGEEQHPQTNVAYGARALEEGTDYTVRYTGGTNAGTYTARIAGAGTYFRGNSTKEFTIEPKPLEASMLTASPASFAYNEQRQEPTITLAFNGKQLVQGVDYDVQISGNPVGVGSYTYTVQGRGNFSGTLTGERQIAQLEHAFEWVTTKAATCADEGMEEETCKQCGFVRGTRSIPKTNVHEFGEWQTKTAETCTTGGLKVRTCKLCGTQEEQVLPAAGHAWGPWETVEPATIVAAGREQRACNICGEVESREIPVIELSDEDLPQKVSGDVSPENPVAAAVVDKQITGMKTDADPKGSTFDLLRAKGVAASKTSVKLTWKKMSGATSYVIYGNRCGKYKCVKVKTVKGTKFTHKKLKKGVYYKYVVVALKGNAALATSKTIHVATKGGKVGNPKSVTVTVKKAKATLQKSQKLKLGAKVVPQSTKLKVKKHRSLKYYSTNKKIAVVNSKGVVTAKSPGKCTIYAYAQNGAYKAVKITVKASSTQTQASSVDATTQQSSSQLQRAQTSQVL